MPSKIKRTEPVDRRRFLRQLASGVIGAAGAGLVTYMARSDEPVYHPPEKIYTIPDFRQNPGAAYPRMVIARGDNPERMVGAAINKLGGIENFIQPGDRVVIKPNAAWDRLPEQAANTNPEVIAAIIKEAKKARPSKIIVTDVSINDPRRVFARSGIENAAQSEGAEIWIPSDEDFLTADLKGSLLTEWPVSRIFLEADKIINAPVVKHHSLSRCTLAQKNWYGILGGRRNRLHQDIHTSISDLAQAMRPTLTVMDATRVLMRGGPTGGSLNDVAIRNTIVAGLDEVAIDSFGMDILGVNPYDVDFMKLSQERGLGKIAWREIHYTEVTV